MIQSHIAVITPAFNSDHYIDRVIQTVKAQTARNVVHYIYDDASTDQTNSLLSKYLNDPTVAVVRGFQNRGQSYGRNTLIKQAIANGAAYIAFLDADDLWDTTHLEESIAALSRGDLVYSKPRFVFEDGRTAVPVDIPVPDVFIGKHLYHNNYIWISSVAVKSECLINKQFDSTLDGIEDWDLWIRLFEGGNRFVKKETATVTYTVKENGAAAAGPGKMYSFDQKHTRLTKLKLHLACGHDYQSDYINVDLYPTDGAVVDAQFDVAKLPYPDNSVDEVRAFHIIEHFDWHQGQRVLEEWYRVLKPGGRLWLETPDFLASCDAFVKGTPEFRNLLYGHFFAMPWIPGQTHKFLFTEDQLRCQLGWAKFGQVNRLPPASNYVLPETYNLFLNVEAFK